jgi:hypothetical protein
MVTVQLQVLKQFDSREKQENKSRKQTTITLPTVISDSSPFDCSWLWQFRADQTFAVHVSSRRPEKNQGRSN